MMVRCTCAVAPAALTATTFSTVVPPVTATLRLKLPSGWTGPLTVVVGLLLSALGAATSIVVPGTDVPVTLTGEPDTAELLAGAGTGARGRAGGRVQQRGIDPGRRAA